MLLKFDSSVCRICLKPQANISFLTENKNYIEEFHFCTQIKVAENDGLPQMFCDECCKRFKIANEFKAQSLASDKHLREFLSKINLNFAEVMKLQNDAECMEYKEVETLYTVLESDEESPIDLGKSPPDDIKQSVSPTLVVIEKDEPISLIDDAELYEEDKIVVEEKEAEVVGATSDNSTADNDEEQDESESEYDNVEFLEATDSDGTEHESFNKFEGKTKYYTERCRSDKLKKIFGCSICGKMYASRASVSRHNRKHREMETHKCSVCGKIYLTEDSLRNHERLHSVDRPHSCSICSQSFTRKYLLSIHMRIHTGEKPFVCQDCGEAFQHRERLKRHLRNVHSKVYTPIYTCKICFAVFTNRTELSLHVKLHSNDEKPLHECDECGKKFSAKSALNLHIRKRHTEKRVYNPEEVKNKMTEFLEGVIPSFKSVAFEEQFILTCTAVERLVNAVHEKWYETNLVGRKRIPVEKAVLLTLHWLASQECFRSVAARFKIHRSVVHVSFLRMCKIIYSIASKYIIWPRGDYARQAADKLDQIFPGAIGCIGTLHVKIKRRATSEAYRNMAGHYTIAVQGTCDADLKFTSISDAFPGGQSEENILRQSSLYKGLTTFKDYISPNHHLVGNQCYPLETFLMVPYPSGSDVPLTAVQLEYNERILRSLSIVEYAFEVLRKNFKRLEYLAGRCDEHYNYIITTACVLHNIRLECHRDDYYIDDIIIKNRHKIIAPRSTEVSENATEAALNKRDLICCGGSKLTRSVCEINV